MERTIKKIIEKIECSSTEEEKKEVIEAYIKDANKSENPELSLYYLENYRSYLDASTIKKLEYNVLNKGEIELAVKLSLKWKKGYIIEKRLLRTQNAKQIFRFLTEEDSIDKSKLEKRLQETNSAEFNCKYAIYVLSNIKHRLFFELEHELKEKDIVELKENQRVELIYNMRLRRINVCRKIEENKKVVLNSKQPKYICELGTFLLNNNKMTAKKKIKKYIDELINCENPFYIYMFLKEVNKKRPDIVSEYKTKIIEQKNPKLIYRIAALLNDKKNDDLEKAILKSNDLAMIFIYAKNIQNIDINYFTQKIIESHNYELMIKYAQEVLNKRNEKISEIQDEIIKSKNTEIIIKFASKVKGADEKECFEPIYNSGNIDIICEFAKKVPNVNKKELSLIIQKRTLQKLSLEKKKDANWSFGFIKNFPEVDFDIHRKIIIWSKDPKLNYEFVKMYPTVSIIQHEKIVLESNDKKYIYLFSQIPGSSIAIEQSTKQMHHKNLKKPKIEIDKITPSDLIRICNRQKHEEIIEFARKFPNTIYEISRILIHMNNPRLSFYFIQSFKNIDLEEHTRIICSNYVWKEKYEKSIGENKCDSQKKKRGRQKRIKARV